MPVRKRWMDFWNGFVQYQTISIVRYDTQSRIMKAIGILYRIIQCIVVIGIFIVIFVVNQSYQTYSDVNGSVTVKLKGVTVTNFSDSEFKVDNPDLYRRIWDVSVPEYQVQENGAFFVMTNVIITPNQTRNGICAENYGIQEAICDPKSPTKNCTKGKLVAAGNGVMTGNCIKSLHPYIHTCEITAWCPLESDKFPLGPDRALLADSKHFTVFIKNDVEFLDFDITRTNVMGTDSYLKSCIYNPRDAPLCPVFKLDTIVTQAGQDYNKLAIQGGIIGIFIKWKCDHLGTSIEKCIPTYRFKRLDKIIQRWNFRYASYYSDWNRTMYKVYGIRFVVILEGNGGKFHIKAFLLSVGSYLGLLGLAQIVCDFLIGLSCVRRLKVFNNLRFIDIDTTTITEQNTTVLPKERIYELVSTSTTTQWDGDSKTETQT